jgi:enoyl-CoA hydratase/carnithine racemase
MVTMNRPREMNALSREMRTELYAVLNELENDDDVRALIITGGEYVFSAGMDIKEMAALADDKIADYFQSILKYLARIYTYAKPVIAAVGGIALGGGFNIATVCDLIIASESAIFGHPELKFGLNPLFSPLRNLVGLAKAKEISMLGEPIGAREALRIGLVNKVATPERFMDEAVAMAEGLAARSGRAIAAVKKISVLTEKLDKQSALDMEFEVMVHLFSSPERKIRMTEFMTREYLAKMKRS